MARALPATAKALRKEIGDLGFEIWVRYYRSGDCWCGAEHGNQKRRDALVSRLQELGFEPKYNGEPGTSGQWIVEI